MENPQKNSYREEVISVMEAARSWTEAKLQKGRLSKPTKVRTKAGQANRGKDQSRKAVTFNQRTKEKQWKGPGKGSKKGETSRKDKPLEILIVQPWQRVAKQRITQTFSPESVTSFPPLREKDRTEGPMIIEA
ncbi:hypothetical protein Tco_1405855 [Tanacetum coccineum]